jgi:hypothetical protein
MVAHSGFITVARKVEPGLWGSAHADSPTSETDLEQTYREDQDR